MEYDVFKKVVRECKSNKTPIRLIGWGEPFVHPQIQDFIEYTKQRNNQLLHITTNGLAFEEYDMSCMVGYGVDSLIFSFQGANEFGYNFMRNTNQYQKLVANIKEFLALRGDNEKPFVQVTTTVFKETPKQIKEFVDYWVDKVDAVSVGRTNFRILPKITPEMSLFMNFASPKKTKKLEHVPCTEVYHQIQVDWDGKVSPCCGDYNNFLTIGNVKNQTIRDMWNKSKRLTFIRQTLKHSGHDALKPCNNCYPTLEGVD